MSKLNEFQDDESQIVERELEELNGGFICIGHVSGTNYADEDEQENIVF